MSQEHDLPSDSDEDDEDYVPDGADTEALSEVESEGDDESSPENENDENKREINKKKGRKAGKGSKSKGAKHKKKVSAKSTNEAEGEEQKEALEQKKQLTEEEEKKRADSLWADFMKDTAVVTTPTSHSSTNGSMMKPASTPKTNTEETVKITKVFEFAGEEVKVEKEVSVNSAEARLSLSSSDNSPKPESPSPAGRSAGRGRGVKRTGLGGISSVLGQLGKKAKISTLEKSKLDWDSYKREENLEEEISTHNKGKDGYLERQDFLQRADLRQFEIEKQLRNTSRRSTR